MSTGAKPEPKFSGRFPFDNAATIDLARQKAAAHCQARRGVRLGSFHQYLVGTWGACSYEDAKVLWGMVKHLVPKKASDATNQMLRLRKALGLSQAEFGRVMNTNRQFVADAEISRAEWSQNQLRAARSCAEKWLAKEQARLAEIIHRFNPFNATNDIDQGGGSPG